MSERPQGLPRLRFAVGCCCAISTIVREHGVAALPAASAAVAPANFGGYGQLTPAFSSRRTSTFLLVACLHAAALGGRMLGLTTQFTKKIPTEFVADVIEKDIPPLHVPSPPNPDMVTTTLDIPIPETPRIPADSDSDSTVAGHETETPRDPRIVEASPPASPHVVNRVQGAPGIGFPTADEYYPPIAIRKEQEGTATVNACVDTQGRLTASPTIVQSTGSATLDEGALRLAKAGSGHYQASTEDGRPVDSCYSFRIRFALRKQ